MVMSDLSDTIQISDVILYESRIMNNDFHLKLNIAHLKLNNARYQLVCLLDILYSTLN